MLFRVFNIACKWPFNRVPSSWPIYKVTFSPTRNFGMQFDFFFFFAFLHNHLSSFGCERQGGVPTLYRISSKRNGFLNFTQRDGAIARETKRFWCFSFLLLIFILSSTDFFIALKMKSCSQKNENGSQF